MGRVINLETAGKERTTLVRAVALAVRELLQQSEVDECTKDLAAFIVLGLESIEGTVDGSVQAWEKRGYWLKADRFRMEWNWTGVLAGRMRTAVLQEDWSAAAVLAVQIAQKLQDVEVPKRNRIGTPWVGAYEHLQAQVR